MQEDAPDVHTTGDDGVLSDDKDVGSETEPEGEQHCDEATATSEEPGLVIDELATLPERAMLDEARLAALLCVTPRTIRRMVSRFELPPPVPLAGRSVWFAGRILDHIEKAAEKAEREAQRQARRFAELSP
jgi:predicted DNA-binding transcriptional regulator AlpA